MKITVVFGALILGALIVVGMFHSETSAEVKPVAPPPDDDQPAELGQVRWLRNFDETKKVSEQSGRPMLVLFQEVPGCGTCVNYGQQVLSHPLIVDAIETLFVPVAIYNNIKGHDEKVLKTFCEPAWNNPVVRIMKADQTELTARLSGKYETRDLVASMIDALRQEGTDIPGYLAVLNEELQAVRPQVATFGMYCFWTGEAAFGKIHGVLSTRPGFKNGSEVVQVVFDPSVINYEQLVKTAKESRCAERVYAHDDRQNRIAQAMFDGTTFRTDPDVRPDSEPKYYMSHTPWKYVPLTPLQSARINSAIRDGQDPHIWVSPRQWSAYQYVASHPDETWNDVIQSDKIIADWNQVVQKMEMK